MTAAQAQAEGAALPEVSAAHETLLRSISYQAASAIMAATGMSGLSVALAQIGVIVDDLAGYDRAATAEWLRLLSRSLACTAEEGEALDRRRYQAGLAIEAAIREHVRLGLGEVRGHG